MLNENFFVYNGINSQDLGLRLTGEFSVGSIEPVVNKIHIPGRNGDLVQYDGSFDNRKISVEFFAIGNDSVDTMARAIYRLTKDKGYHKLKLSTDGDYFYLARVESFGKTENRLGKLVLCSITFDCKPQKFMDNGDIWMYSDPMASSMTILNYGGECEPLMAFAMMGTVQNTITVNSFTLTIPAFAPSATSVTNLYIDCESQNVYSDTTNYNYLVGMQAFPKLVNGTNTITVTTSDQGGDIGSFAVKTRSFIL